MQQVFSEGKSFSVFPLKVFYMEIKDNQDFAIKTGVGASSRSFKKAVHRNRIKRLLRESYRLNKHLLHSSVQGGQQQVAIFILYIDKVLPNLQVINEKMPMALNKLIKRLHEKATPST